MSAFRAALIAATLTIASLAQTITLPSFPGPGYVSNNWLYYNKMRWGGAWSSLTTYNPQDVVTSSGYTYVSLAVANLNNAPAPGGTIYWAQLPTIATTWGTIGGTLSTQSDLASALAGKEPSITAGTSSQYWRGDKSWQALNTAVFGLLSGTAPISFNGSTGAFACATCLTTGGSYTDPAWLALTVGGGRMSGTWTAGNGGTGSAAPTAHGVAVAQGAATPFNFVAPSTLGYVLTDNGAGNDPSYQAPFSLPSGSQLQYFRLKPNAGNATTVQAASLPQLNTADYNYAALTPSSPSTLTGGGGSQTITVAICPLGIYSAGTSAWASVYLAAGSGGTAEAVTPSGGTCSAATLGIGGGTVIVSPASNHGAGYTLASATSGIQEALNSGANVSMPAGTLPVYATIAPPVATSYRLIGAGRGVTKLSTTYTGGPIILLNNPSSSVVEDFEIDGSSTGSNYAISMTTGWNTVLERLRIVNVANGISMTGDLELNVVRDTEVNFTVNGTGLYCNGTSGSEACGTFERDVVGCTAANSGGTGFNVVQGAGIFIRRTYVVGCAAGLLVDPGNAQAVAVVDAQGLYLDGFNTSPGYGMYFSPAAGGSITGVRMNQSSSVGFSYGLVFGNTGTLGDFTISDSSFLGNQQQGIYTATGLTFHNFLLENDLVEGNGLAAPGTLNGATFSAVTNLTIRGGVWAAGAQAGSNSQAYGIAIGSGNTNVLIDGPIVTPNASGGIYGASGTTTIIRNAIGYNPVGPSTLTCAGSPCTLPAAAAASPATLYLAGGTVSGVTRGGSTVCTADPCAVNLPPGGQAVVTYSSVPTTITLDVQ